MSLHLFQEQVTQTQRNCEELQEQNAYLSEQLEFNKKDRRDSNEYNKGNLKWLSIVFNLIVQITHLKT